MNSKVFLVNEISSSKAQLLQHKQTIKILQKQIQELTIRLESKNSVVQEIFNKDLILLKQQVVQDENIIDQQNKEIEQLKKQLSEQSQSYIQLQTLATEVTTQNNCFSDQQKNLQQLTKQLQENQCQIQQQQDQIVQFQNAQNYTNEQIQKIYEKLNIIGDNKEFKFDQFIAKANFNEVCVQNLQKLIEKNEQYFNDQTTNQIIYQQNSLVDKLQIQQELFQSQIQIYKSQNRLLVDQTQYNEEKLENINNDFSIQQKTISIMQQRLDQQQNKVQEKQEQFKNLSLQLQEEKIKNQDLEHTIQLTSENFEEKENLRIQVQTLQETINIQSNSLKQLQVEANAKQHKLTIQQSQIDTQNQSISEYNEMIVTLNEKQDNLQLLQIKLDNIQQKLDLLLKNVYKILNTTTPSQIPYELLIYLEQNEFYPKLEIQLLRTKISTKVLKNDQIEKFNKISK